MKRTALLLTATLFFLLNSCQSLHRGIPMADRNHRSQKVVSTEKVVVLREVTPSETIVRENEKPVTATIVPETSETNSTSGAIADLPVAAKPTVVIHDDTIRKIVDPEPEKSDEEILDEAMESERVARRALDFAYVPIVSIIFFPALFIGIIGTLTALSRFRRYEYVTEKGLEYERRARLTLLLSCLLPFAVLILFILLLVLLL